MLFLYRPQQTWMPHGPPRQRMQQDAYNRRLQDAYHATRVVGPAASGLPSEAPGDDDVIAQLERLGRLHDAGALDDPEFAAAKAKVLGTRPETT
jgi:hypothetical protein